MLSKEGGNSNQIVVQRIIKLHHVGIGRNFSVWLIRKKLMIKNRYFLFAVQYCNKFDTNLWFMHWVNFFSELCGIMILVRTKAFILIFDLSAKKIENINERKKPK